MKIDIPKFMRIILTIIMVAGIVVIFRAVSGGFRRDKALPKLEDTLEGYSMTQAQADGNIVVKGFDLFSTLQQWNDFYQKTREGKSADIRIYRMQTEPADSYSVEDLSFNGKIYRLQFYERDPHTHEPCSVDQTFKYLLEDSFKQDGEVKHVYLLSDSREVTFEGWIKHFLSSKFPRPDDAYSKVRLVLRMTEESAD